jgi:hypothetical protein
MTRTLNTSERIMRRALGTVAVLGLLAGTTLIAPQQDGGIGFEGHPVFAAPGGNGNGNGNGADNGNGGNSGNAGDSGNAGNGGADTASADAGDSDGKPGQGHAFGKTDRDDDETAHASELGRLNAAHASETARANAAPNSAVGQTAAYERDVLDGDLESAASDFAAAANKDIIEPVVHAVNELLGIDDAEVDRDDETDGEIDPDSQEAADRLTVHGTEGEVAARANGTFDPSTDGDTKAPDEARDS